MRVAVCFSGQIRSAERALPTYINYFCNYPADVFAHTWDVDTRGFLVKEPLTPQHQPYYVLRTVPQHELDYVKNILHARTFQVENYAEFYQRNEKMNINHPHIIAQVHSWRSSVDSMIRWSNRHDINFDLVIKLRYDLIYKKTVTLKDLVEVYQQHGPDKFWVNDVIGGLANDIIYMASPLSHRTISHRWAALLNLHHQPAEAFNSLVARNDLNLMSIGPAVSDPSFFTILRPDCPFNPHTELEKCREFWRLFYQDLHLTPEGLADLHSLTVSDLYRAVDHVNKLFGYVPPALAQFLIK